ncbi:prenyltransferase/squalene oxidase repeat-containing protein [Nocardia stercoris]|uniref:Prenyltransferase n=1 Tax=Nocardia stercoris TaxID=2483361 RepID=A0A3M2KTR6_9NOCA|nr:prenyltransferase [Nocardia stercoris]RMI28334.1 prenyltransferase [Nocardia stercoris]
MRAADLPAVAGVLSAREIARSAASIAAAQEPDGAVPWFTGGHTDPWDHVESAMALTAAGLHDLARAAYVWSAKTQRDDGSWPMQFRQGTIENHDADTNFCAYLATGLLHFLQISGDRDFVAELWPTVRAGIDFVLTLQGEYGEIYWSAGESGHSGTALLTGSSSIFHSLGCAVELADRLGDPRPDWVRARHRLGTALRDHPEAFLDKSRYSMDWYYPILSGAIRAPAARTRIDAHWTTFVVPDLGARCVSDAPWVTGAETCELVLALDAINDTASATTLFTQIQHLREPDGSYWTGLVFADGKRWPEERTTWTAAAVILAADALSRTTPGNSIFRTARPD